MLRQNLIIPNISQPLWLLKFVLRNINYWTEVLYLVQSFFKLLLKNFDLLSLFGFLSLDSKTCRVSCINTKRSLSYRFLRVLCRLHLLVNQLAVLVSAGHLQLLQLLNIDSIFNLSTIFKLFHQLLVLFHFVVMFIFKVSFIIFHVLNKLVHDYVCFLTDYADVFKFFDIW